MKRRGVPRLGLLLSPIPATVLYYQLILGAELGVAWSIQHNALALMVLLVVSAVTGVLVELWLVTVTTARMARHRRLRTAGNLAALGVGVAFVLAVPTTVMAGS